MKPRAIWRHLALFLPLALVMGASASRAAVSFDVAVGMNVNEDTRIFLNITNETWQPAAPAAFLPRCRYPEDDFPVVAFLAFQSHRDPAFILRLRSDGYPWSAIFYRLRVDPGVLFLGIDRDPGPPYGKAWGYWRSHRGPAHRARFRMSDRDVVGLVKVQTVARHFGASPFNVINAQRRGERVEAYGAGRWREKHGRRNWVEGRGDRRGNDEGRRGRGSDEGRGKSGKPGKGKGNGHGKDHGRGNGHDR